MREVLKWLDENAELWMLLFLYSCIVLVIAIEVIRRFGLMYSSVWGEEAARYAFIYLVWIGAAVAVRDRAHIRIDVITHLMPPPAAALIYLLAALLTVPPACLAIYWSLVPVLVSCPSANPTHPPRIIRGCFLIAAPSPLPNTPCCRGQGT